MQTTTEDKEQKTKMSFADCVFFVVAMCLAIFIKPSQYLMENHTNWDENWQLARNGVNKVFGC